MEACDAVRELLAAHVLACLGENEEALVGDHLGSCSECQAAESRARQAVSLIEAPAVVPPPKVWAGIQAKIAHGRAGDDPVRVAPTAVVSVSCSFCRGGLLRPEAVYCASCLSPHHPDCFEDHGRCSVMGCGETRVVRPADLPPLEEVMDARRRYRASRRLRRNWLLGGIAILGGGTLAALSGTAGLAETAPRLAEATTASTPSPSVTPSPAPSVGLASASRGPLFDVEIQNATLEQVVDALSEASGAQVLLLPALHDVLVRERSWSKASWSDVLEDLADDLGLLCETQDQGALAVLLPGEDSSRLERAGQEFTRYRSWWAEGPGRTREFASDLAGPRTLTVAEPGARLALGAGRRLLVFKAGESMPIDQGSLPGPLRSLAWSPSGRQLAFMTGPLDAPRLGMLERLGRGPHWLDKGRVERVGELAWLGEGALVISHAEGIDEVVLGEDEAATRQAWALPSQVAQLADGRLWVERPGASEVWRSLQATRVLSFSPEGFQVLEAGSGRALSPRFARPHAWGDDPRSWPVRLRPGGEHVAWVDSTGSWFHASLKGDGPPTPRERGFTSEGGGDDPSDPGLPRLSWSLSGDQLLFWSGGRLTFLTFEGVGMKDPDRFSLSVDAWAEGERVVEAVWCRESLLVTTTSSQPRTGVVDVSLAQVEPVEPRQARPQPTPTELQLEGLDLGAIWRPRMSDQPAPPFHPLPGENRPPVAQLEVEPAATPEPTPEPTPVATPAVTPTEPEPNPVAAAPSPSPEPTLALPEPTVDLSHVSRGQRWVFSHGEGGIDEVWTIEGVGIDEVHYQRQFRVAGRPVGEEELHTWQPKTDAGARAIARGAARGDETLETVQVEGLGALTCAVVRVEGVETWRALGGDAITFPGAVRELRDGAEQRSLTRVEQP